MNKLPQPKWPQGPYEEITDPYAQELTNKTHQEVPRLIRHPNTHLLYRLRHVTISPTQLKTKLLGSEPCKWYVFVVSFAGPLSYILVCVKAGSAMQLVVKPHQLMVKENRLAYMIAKSVGTLLFSKCCKAIPNSFEASPAKTSTAHRCRPRPTK